MLRSLNAGVTGLQQFQQKLDVIGNNIANSNTSGYKMARAEFEDNFSQSLSAGGSGPIQIGSGVTTATVRSVFRQGISQETGVESNMAINGEGFFTVRDPISNNSYVTRAGDFVPDREGYLVNGKGYRLQGYSDGGTTRGDLKLDDTGKPAGNTGVYESYQIDSKGRVTVKLDNGTDFLRGTVLLQRFMDPNALTKEGGNLYSASAAAGAAGDPQPPDTTGLGEIKASNLEMSNVDLANEFATLITTQRGFQASARIITTSDEVLQEVVNLKR